MRVFLVSFLFLMVAGSALAQDGHRVVTFKNSAGDVFIVYRTDDPSVYLWYDSDGTMTAKVRGDAILFRSIEGSPLGGVVRRVSDQEVSLEYYNEPAKIKPMDRSIIGFFYKNTIEDFWLRQ